MTHHRVRGVLAAALSLSVLAACSVGCRPGRAADPPPSAASADSEAPAAEATDDERSDGPAPGPVVSDPEAVDLDLAVSTPREDSVYPAVGDPRVDALHYDLDLTWEPDDRAPHRRGGHHLPCGPHGAPLPARPRTRPHRRRGRPRRRADPLRPARQGPRAARADPGGPALRAQPRLRRHAGAGPGPDHAQRLQHDRLHGDPHGRGVDDAGALRRLHLVPRQRPAVRQGALRHHRPRPVASGPASPTASSRSSSATPRARPRRGSSTSRRRRTSSPLAIGDYVHSSNTSRERAAGRLLDAARHEASARLDQDRGRDGRLDRDPARRLPLRLPRPRRHRLAERDGDPDDGHARHQRLRPLAAGGRPRDRPPVVRRPGLAGGLARRVAQRGHDDAAAVGLRGRARPQPAAPERAARPLPPTSSCATSSVRPAPTTRASSAAPTSTTRPR